MKINTLPAIALIITTACLSIMAGCKKNDLSKKQTGTVDPPPIKDPVLPPDSGKTIYIGEFVYQQGLVTPATTTIFSYDAATGGLLHTFNYLRDFKKTRPDSSIQYLAVQTGNGFLYDIETDRINALDMSSGAVRWTDSLNYNAATILHDQTFYGISLGDLKPYNGITNSGNFVYALDASAPSGTYLWKYPISLSGVAGANYPHPHKNIPYPIYYNGLLYVMADATHLIALDAATGKLMWTFQFSAYTPPAGSDYYVYTVPKIKDGLIYCSASISQSRFDDQTYIINAATGLKKDVIRATGTFLGLAGNLILTTNGALDINTKTLKWGGNIGPVFGVSDGGVISEKETAGHDYANLALSDFNTGQSKWISGGVSDGAGMNTAIVVNNTLYQSGATDAYALDLYTAKIKWSQPRDYNAPQHAICVVGISGRCYLPYSLWVY